MLEVGNLTDFGRLDRAFAQFKEMGYWARLGVDNGYKAVPEDVWHRSGKVVLWHGSETDSAFDIRGTIHRPLHLKHLLRDTDEIVEVLKPYFGDRLVVDLSDRGGVIITPDGPPIQDTYDSILGLIGARYEYSGDQLVIDHATKQTVRMVSEKNQEMFVAMPWSTFKKLLSESLIRPIC